MPAEQKGRVQALADARFALLNKRVLDDRGDESGTVHDVDFDPESGRVTSVITSTGSLDGDRLDRLRPLRRGGPCGGRSEQLTRSTYGSGAASDSPQ